MQETTFLLVIYRTVGRERPQTESYHSLTSPSNPSEDGFCEKRVTVGQELTLSHTGLHLMITLLSPP